MPVRVTADEARSVVLDYLERFLDDVEGIDDTPLITGGLLDSLVVVQLIDHLQQSFDIAVADEDLELSNFDSVNAIVGLVARKTGGS
ncbi:acyl carrier protein [Catenulispora sp. NF23]|uniref:Acyl carrier protein n=1 Tax=Catenulispora pinistramenti TaxID=2705254 RepID=A0ABS5KR89_9ACTN|nr:acyl carrier protein [Catenulispora pinistramenti]MBS2533105.1 acyl carrier protein [Catenulispora pinistramenti]MBS2548568.1 acyl carrier protein [Catenulispora pinistramenti]